jgi:outer membrane protein OmpA-like peptidoglycan-associated protein
MHNRLFIFCVLTVLVTACSTTPRLPTPDGRQRVPANDPAAIERYKERAAEAKVAQDARSSMTRQLDDVKQELSSIKAFLAALPIDEETGTIRSAGTIARIPKSPTIRRAANTRSMVKDGRQESIDVVDQSVIFRVMYPVAGTKFKPTDTLQVQLLKAAASARRLDIRGSSDGDMADADNRKVAMDRAQAARQFLIDHGIPASRIRVSAVAAGEFNAPSGDELLRTRNRRVEIEAMDLDTSPYQTNEPITKGGRK